MEIRYIPTRENAFADALSRMLFSRFLQVAQGAEPAATDVSGVAQLFSLLENCCNQNNLPNLRAE